MVSCRVGPGTTMCLSLQEIGRHLLHGHCGTKCVLSLLKTHSRSLASHQSYFKYAFEGALHVLGEVFHGNRLLQVVVDAAHVPPDQPARHNPIEIRQRSPVNVHCQTVHRDPSANLDAQSRHFSVRHPYPRNVILPGGPFDSRRFQCHQYRLLKGAHVPMYVLMVPPQIQYGVHDELTGTVISDLAPSLYSHYVHVREPTLGCRFNKSQVGPRAQSVHWRVLQHDDAVVSTPGGGFALRRGGSQVAQRRDCVLPLRPILPAVLWDELRRGGRGPALLFHPELVGQPIEVAVQQSLLRVPHILEADRTLRGIVVQLDATEFSLGVGRSDRLELAELLGGQPQRSGSGPPIGRRGRRYV
mmetsp:Transcript_40235/g.121223  ORF Transcript_40235/g.121223 Transcript_40235/m.121223 type:complete len:357 (-) Transcript_40235:424-1494(-)